MTIAKYKKMIAWVLVFMLAFQVSSPLYAADVKASGQGDYGNLEVSIRLTYPTTNQMTINLVDGNVSSADLTFGGRDAKESTITMNNEPYQVVFTPLNGEGTMALSNERVYTYHLLFKQIPCGEYKVKLKSLGYGDYVSNGIAMGTHSVHLLLDTATTALVAGDFNEDGQVDQTDLNLLKENLLKDYPATGKNPYDLTGDNIVDIEDLSRSYWGVVSGAKGKGEIKQTALLPKGINTKESQNEFDFENAGASTIGDLAGILDGSAQAEFIIERKIPLSVENPIQIPVSFKEETKVSQVQITPGATGIPTSGNVVYLDEHGVTQKVPFVNDSGMSKARSRAATAPGVITIKLGKQVPVQKITIEVTGTTGGNAESGFLTAITKIEFLEDVVDNAVNQELGIIKGLATKGLDGAVAFSWNSIPNVTGYKVHIGAKSGQYTDYLLAETNKVTVKSLNSEKLENNTPYYFAVQGVNGGWQGPLSQEIVGTPVPQSKPKAPSNVLIEEGNGQLAVNWGGSEIATGWYLYYKKTQDAAYTKVANITKPQYALVGLANDQSYQVYVTAYNEMGESGSSQIVVGTPKIEETNFPEPPTHQEIIPDKVKSIKLINPSNVDMSFYPNGFAPQNVIDGNYNTHWTAKTYQQARGFEVTFDQAYEMNYLAWMPRLGKEIASNRGEYKYAPGYYSITIWESADSQPKELVKWKTVIPSSGIDGVNILPFAPSMVYKIKVEMWEKDGSPNMSASELKFYEYDPLIEEIDALFADGTYSTLAPGVNEKTIQGLKEKLEAMGNAYLAVPKTILLEELAIARDLATNGSSDKIQDLLVVTQGRSAGADGDRQFANGRGISELQPTGYMGMAKDQIVVYVDAKSATALPELVVSQYFSGGTWKRSIPLVQGRNVITIPELVTYKGDKGGAIYLTYAGESAEDVKVQIRNARPMPMVEVLDLGQSADVVKAELKTYIQELTAYVAALDKKKDLQLNPANVTEIGTDKVLLSLPASQVLLGLQAGGFDLDEQVDRLYESLLTWEKNMVLQYAVHGLTENAENSRDQWPSTRFNIRYMRMSEKAFMYAAADHSGIRWGSEAPLVQGQSDVDSGYFGWGINHELGHILNTNEYIYGEITNNIFALFAQTINGGPSRLETSEIYEQAYQKVVSENPGLSANVFVTLTMFWQLHLAYDDGEGAGTFYPALNQLFRTDATTGVDKDNMLVRLASDVAQKDLVPFFSKWDFAISEDTKSYTSKYPAEDRAIYYLNDAARDYRLSGGNGMANPNDISATASLGKDAVTDETQVNIAITTGNNDADMLGYEIYRNGQLIAFTTEKTYVDKMPGANNVSLSYAVKGFDKLLGETSLVKTNEVYLAYDGTMDQSGFTITKENDGAILIDMASVKEVVGLTVKGVNLSPILPEEPKEEAPKEEAPDQGATDEGTLEEESADANEEAAGAEIPVGEVPKAEEPGTGNGLRIEVKANQSDQWMVVKDATIRNGDNHFYFNKPGAASDDQRIWTYDAQYVRLSGTGLDNIQTNQVQMLAYPGDGVYFMDNAIGRLGHDYVYNGGVIKQGTLVVVGGYRGHPVFSKILLTGKYIQDDCEVETASTTPKLLNAEGVEVLEELTDEPMAFSGQALLKDLQEETERAISGEMFLLAELPEDGQVSKIDNGIWIFVPKDQILPTGIKARMYRTEEAESTEGGRLVSDTIWLNVPADESLPSINFE